MSEQETNEKFKWANLLKGDSRILFDNLDNLSARNTNVYTVLAIKTKAGNYFDNLQWRNQSKYDENKLIDRLNMLRDIMGFKGKAITHFPHFVFLFAVDMLETLVYGPLWNTIDWDSLDSNTLSQAVKIKHERKLAMLQARNPDNSLYKKLYHSINDTDYTVEDWRKDCEESDVDYKQIEKTFSIELSPSHRIKFWLERNLSEPIKTSDVKQQMIEAGIIRAEDWPLAQKIASQEGYSSGKRGYWQA